MAFLRSLFGVISVLGFLGKSKAYVQVCILLPLVNGLINTYCAGAFSLHYVDMGWPVSRSGWPYTIGYLLRPFFQQLQVRLGFWVSVPLGLIHLAAVIIGIIFTDEWSVIIEVGASQAVDAAMTIEGIAFDTFSLSEVMARQAGSTVLAVFTMSVAASVTIGGLIYDTLGYKACSIYHLVCEVALLSLLMLQPAVWKSFKEFWFKESETETMKEESGGDTLPIVPTQPAQREGEDEMYVEDLDLPGAVKDDELMESSQVDAAVERSSQQSGTPGRQSGRRSPNLGSPGRHPGRRSQESAMTRNTRMTGGSARTCRTAISIRTGRTNVTGKTGLSRITALTSLKDSNDFQYHFAASTALSASIAQRAGPSDEEKASKSISVPKDLRWPLFLIVLCDWGNAVSYMFEYSTFAIYFKEYHGWDAAVWASLAQTSGDLFAAIIMKAIPDRVDEEVEDVGLLKRLRMQPYNLSCLLFCWIICNAGMISPLLAIAVIAQIFMGTVFVYTVKMMSDLNLFYSLGDSDMFMKFTGYCKNAEALGACAATLLGPLLYDQVSPFDLCFMVTLLS